MPVVSSARAIAILVVGQAVWASGQFVVVGTLIRLDEFELIGLFGLALGGFALTSLLLGMNLRLAIATDVKRTINLRTAIRLRLTTTIGAFAVVTGGVWLYSDDRAASIATSCLLTSRIADQLADVSIGEYQRRSARWLIARSSILRGGVVGGIFGVFALTGMPVWSAGLLSGLAVITVTYVFDIASLLREGASPSDSTPCMALIRSQRSMASFPFLDTLHVTSLRYTVAATVDPHTLGVFTAVQTFFTPVGLLVSSGGVVFLASISQAAASGRYKTALLRSSRCLVACAGFGVILNIITMLFIAEFSLVVPVDVRALFLAALSGLMLTLTVVPASGFSSLSLAVVQRGIVYSLAPAVGLGAFLALWGSMQFFDEPLPQLAIYWTCGVYSLSHCVRIALTHRSFVDTISSRALAHQGR